MISPTRPFFWQAFAQGVSGVLNGFAMARSARHCFWAGHRQPSHDLRSQRCYPSPSLRSGPSQAGPTLALRRGGADCVKSGKNCFETCDIAVESAAITTNLRGSSKCRSRLSSSLFFPRLWPVACRTLRPAAWLVPPQARLSPMRWMKTCLPAPHSAVLLALPPAASSWACRPAATATDLAAFGRALPPSRTIRADRPGGPFLFASEGGADV